MSNKSDIDYSRVLRYTIISIIIIIVLILNYCSLSKHMSSNSQSITDYTIPEEYVERSREPVVAGLFYPADKITLDKKLDSYLSHSLPLDKFPVQPKILIVPHAGYDYSAAVAAKAYLTLQPFASQIKNVILVGPSHQVSLHGAALSHADSFKTPLGSIKLNSQIVQDLSAKPHIRIWEEAHQSEHSLEVQLPFLQKILPDFSIVPVVYGNISPEALADLLRPYLSSSHNLVIFSADLSHYHDYETAQSIDGHTAEQIKRRQADLEAYQSCGATGINAALILAKDFKLTPEMLDLRNSGDVMGTHDKVVGYGSWSFSYNANADDAIDSIAKDQKSLADFVTVHGQTLMKIARISLEEALLYGKHYSPSRKDYDNTLFDKGASYFIAQSFKLNIIRRLCYKGF